MASKPKSGRSCGFRVRTNGFMTTEMPLQLDGSKRIKVAYGYRMLQGETETPDKQFWRKLWSLKLPGATWKEVGLQNNINILQGDNVFDVIRRSFERHNREQCALCQTDAKEWRNAQKQQLTSGTSIAAPMAVRKWERPQDGWIKVNIEAALFESIDCIRLRIIVRGADGQFIMARIERKPGLISPGDAEALCLKEALSCLTDESFGKCMFETDSQVLARTWVSSVMAEASKIAFDCDGSKNQETSGPLCSVCPEWFKRANLLHV
ncbi:hypothetical protein AgCh_000723 [Apium graveolens]